MFDLAAKRPAVARAITARLRPEWNVGWGWMKRAARKTDRPLC